jgi:hypothetical protein
MSTRNYNFSAIVNIMRAQNAANNYNRQQTIAKKQSQFPYNTELDLFNPQTGNFDADTIINIQAGQQVYYFKGDPITTVIVPEQFIVNPITTPPVIDNLTNSLSTSITAYNNAANGDWVTITAAEYATLQTTVLSTQLAGASASLLNAATSVPWTNSIILGGNKILSTASGNSTAIPANAYVYAFAVQYWGLYSNPNMLVYTNTNSSSNTGFNQLGGTLPATFANSTAQSYINYYILKNPSARNGSTAGNLAVYTGGPNIGGQSSGHWLSYVSTPGISAIQYKTYTPTGAPPYPPIPTAADILNGTTALAIGIQALTTPIRQWN